MIFIKNIELIIKTLTFIGENNSLSQLSVR